MAKDHRKRRHRRTAKQVLAHGPRAKRKHAHIGGRSGKIRSAQLKQGSVRL